MIWKTWPRPRASPAILRWCMRSITPVAPTVWTLTPNAAHDALGHLQAKHSGRVTLVTQNVDDLHERGGATDVIHMHGELAGALCAQCDHRWPAPREMSPSAPCPSCNAPRTRPDIVWFGEMPYQMDMIYAALGRGGPVRRHRHLGHGLSGRRVRRRSTSHGHPDARAEPGALGHSGHFRRGTLWSGDPNCPSVGGRGAGLTCFGGSLREPEGALPLAPAGLTPRYLGQEETRKAAAASLRPSGVDETPLGARGWGRIIAPHPQF